MRHPRPRRNAVPRPPRRRRGARARPRRDALQPRRRRGPSSFPRSRSCTATATATSPRSTRASFGRRRRHERLRAARRAADARRARPPSATTRSSRRSPPTPTSPSRATRMRRSRSCEEETEEYRGEAYGPLKALCEEVVQRRFRRRCRSSRPGLIVGPWNPTGRFTYWPQRFAAGGEVLAPRAGRRRRRR